MWSHHVVNDGRYGKLTVFTKHHNSSGHEVHRLQVSKNSTAGHWKSRINPLNTIFVSLKITGKPNQTGSTGLGFGEVAAIGGNHAIHLLQQVGGLRGQALLRSTCSWRRLASYITRSLR